MSQRETRKRNMNLGSDLYKEEKQFYHEPLPDSNLGYLWEQGKKVLLFLEARNWKQHLETLLSDEGHKSWGG